MYHPFSVAETTKTAWDIYKKNFITIVVYSIISFLLVFIMSFVVGFLIPSEDFYPRLLGSLVVVFIQAYTTLGLYKLIFTLIDSEYYEFEVKQVLPPIGMIFSYLAVVVIIGFFIATYRIFVLNKLDKDSVYYQIADYAGVTIGLYAAIRIMFFNTYVVDDRSGPIESLRQSIGLTRDHTSKILLVMAIIGIVYYYAGISMVFNTDTRVDLIFSICLSFCEHHINCDLP